MVYKVGKQISKRFLNLFPACLQGPIIMPHKMFIIAYKNGPLGYLISTRKALGVLLAHKIGDSRLQMFVLKWAVVMLAVLGAGICGFNLMPIFFATGLLAPGIFLFALFLWLGAGDIFLKFALEDERFYNLATESRALSVFEDTEYSMPQSVN
jgi:hypothetical protein